MIGVATQRRRFEVGEVLAGERVDRAVALLCDLPRAIAAALVAGGAVSIDGAEERGGARRVRAGEVVEVDHTPDDPAPVVGPDAAVRVPVVWDSDDAIVVDKPAGLVVHPGAGHTRGTLAQGLLAAYPEIAEVGEPARPGIVHRLDAGTSGLMVVARSQSGYDSLVSQLKQRTVHRRYLALVWGRMESPSGLVDAPVGRAARDRTTMTVATGGRDARTRYEVRQWFERPENATMVECSLETGRTHQIRVHMKAIGHPVVGDARYNGARSSIPLGRPFLHATTLEFHDPASGESRRFESPLAADLEAVLAFLN